MKKGRILITHNAVCIIRFFNGLIHNVSIITDFKMRSKSKIEKEYHKLRLRSIALVNKIDDYESSGKPYPRVNTDWEMWTNEEETVRNKMWVLAYVLGYSKTM